jgi:D-3-phosphoglycerate dehydrogenase
MTAPTLAAAAERILHAGGCVVHYLPPYPSAEVVAEAVASVAADAILCRQGRVTGAVMDASPRLRIVARHGVGMDEVDVPEAAARGLLVTRAPGSNTRATAEHTLALMLALAKNLLPASAAVAAGGWRGADSKGRDLHGMRVGLVGFGPIGRAVARMAGALGMAVTVLQRGAVELPADVRRAGSLPALLEGSDVLSLHCPLTAATHHMIGAASLALLPRGALLVNTARGGLVDADALLAALDRGHLAGAGLDVFEAEPPPPDHRLRRHPRVIATPHVAGVTDASLTAMGVMAAECIVAALTGGVVPPDRIVSPACNPAARG